MTDQIFDDRASAYVGAREALKAAGKAKAEHVRAVYEGRAIGDPDELPPAYWGLLAEAGVLAQLARADIAVGLLAGNYLVDQERRIRKNKDRQLHEQIQAKAAAKRISTGGTEDGRGVVEHLADNHGDHPEARCSDCGTTNAGRTCQPPFAEGHRVRVNNDVMEGKYAGRLGTVTKVGVDDGADWVEVSLDPMEGLRYGGHATITVRAHSLELV